MLREAKILYAEDEDFIRESMLESLSFFCDNVIAVADTESAYKVYLEEKPDILFVDIEMPGLNGLELAEKIRKEDQNIQIVVTTAYTDTKYFLKAVELNLVKYLLKPISFDDLKDTLVLCSKNLTPKEKPHKYFDDEVYYDTEKEQLFIKGIESYLDFQERSFLTLLTKAAGRVVSYDELENHIWCNGLSEGAVRTLVFALRKKLPKKTIENIPKVGYKIVIKE
ncbi:MAG: DNA-binding response OmpR family regulator [Sulfurimonas sp.]|jgi:DNA-binding response OmpR family regulator